MISQRKRIKMSALRICYNRSNAGRNRREKYQRIKYKYLFYQTYAYTVLEYVHNETYEQNKK